MQTLEKQGNGDCAENDEGKATQTFDWSTVGFIAAVIGITIVLGLLFT